MRAEGTFKGADIDFDTGGLILKFVVSNTDRVRESLDSIRNTPLMISVNKPKIGRSLTANAYFWQLVDKIGKVLGCDKWVVYLMQLSKYGVFTDVDIQEAALPVLRKHFRYVEVFNDGYEEGTTITVRCYYGSSGYDTKEMSDLIEGTVRDAEDLGIETLTPNERERLIQSWERR